MNERIRELLEQVGVKYVTMPDDTVYEKFAELIVKECIGIIEPTSHHKAFAQGYLGDVDGLELLDNKVKKIKEHFGVDK